MLKISHKAIIGDFDPPGNLSSLGSPFIQNDPFSTGLTLNELTPYTNYTVSVCALTFAGCGLNSMSIAQTDEDGELLSSRATSDAHQLLLALP